MKFIHASDFHLCSSFHQSSLPSEVAATHRDQLWQTFYRIVETCRKDQIDLLLISGDLYEHEYAKLSDVKRIADAFDTIPHTKILIACGNHDPLYERSYYKVLEFPQNVFIFPSEYTFMELEELNTIVYGFSWNRTRYDSIPFTFDQQKKAVCRDETLYFCKGVKQFLTPHHGRKIGKPNQDHGKISGRKHFFIDLIVLHDFKSAADSRHRVDRDTRQIDRINVAVDRAG